MDTTNNTGSPNIRSMIASGVSTIAPLIGLGVAGYNANKLGIGSGLTKATVINPIPHGKASRLDMIGRMAGASTQDHVAASFEAARKSYKRNFEKLNGASYREALVEGGKKRSAVLAAYRSMLNSPYLGLNEHEIEMEQKEILSMISSKNNEEIADSVLTRIRKRMNEFGSTEDRQAEFLEEFNSQYKAQLNLEAKLENGTIPQIDWTKSFDISTSEGVAADVIKSSLDKKTAAHITEIQKMIAEQGLTGKHSFTIYKVTDTRFKGGHTWMGRIESNGASFDLPLAFNRDGFKHAVGGIGYQSTSKGGRVSYSSGVALSGSMPSISGDLVSGERTFLPHLRTALERLRMGSLPQDVEKAFIDATFETGQRVATQFNGPQRNKLFEFIQTAQITDPSYKATSAAHQKILVSNKAINHGVGVPYAHLANGRVMQRNNRTVYGITGPFKAGDTTLKAKTTSNYKENVVLESNRVLNERLGWMDNTNFSDTVVNDLEHAASQLASENRRSSIVVYQFPDESGLTPYRRKYKIHEGGYIGKGYGYQTPPSSIKNIALTNNDEFQGTALLKKIIEGKKKGKPIQITRKELEASEGILGRHLNGGVAQLPFDATTQSITIDPHYIRLDNKTGGVNLSYTINRRRTRFTKIKSNELKGQMVSTSAATIKSEAAATLGENPFYLNHANAVVIADIDQVMREESSMKTALHTAGQMVMSENQAVNKEAIFTAANRWAKAGKTGSAVDMAVEIARDLAAGGYSHQQISRAVSGQYYKSKKAGDMAAAQRIIDAGGGSEFGRVLSKSRGFIGVSTYGVDVASELQGAGKMASIERRSLHAMYQSMKTLNLDDKVVAGTISNIMRRTSPHTALHKRYNTMHALDTSYFSMLGDGQNLAAYNNFANRNKFSLNIGELSIGKFNENLDLLKRKEFRQNHLIKLNFDTDQARAAAIEAFGRADDIYVPGQLGMTGLEKTLNKTATKNIHVATEYQNQLGKTLGILNADNSVISHSEKVKALLALKDQTAISIASAKLEATSGKVAGSMTGRLWSLDKLANESGDNALHYARMMRTAKSLDHNVIFFSDKSFFSAISQMKKYHKMNATQGGQKDLIENVNRWIFGTGKEGGGVITGFSERFPTLGEGHGSLRGAARLVTDEHNAHLFNLPETRTFMNEHELGDSLSDFNNFLARKNGTVEQRHAFSKLMYSKASTISNTATEATAAYTGHYVDMTLNGKAQKTFISPMIAQYGDADGDVAHFILNLNKENRSELYGAFKARAYRGKNVSVANLAFNSDYEFAAALHSVKNYHKLNQSNHGFMTEVDSLADERMKMILSKKVEMFSTDIDRLKVSMLGNHAIDSVSSRQSMTALTIIEELMLKSKKSHTAINIAEELNRIINYSNHKIDPTEAKEAFMRLMKEHVIDGEMAKVDYDVGGVTGKFDWHDILSNIWDNHKTLVDSKENYNTPIKRVLNQLKKAEVDEATRNRVESLMIRISNGEGGLAQSFLEAAMESGYQRPVSSAFKLIGSKISEKVVSTLSNSKVWGPAAIGVGLGLLALGMNAPGYSPKELGPMDPAEVSPHNSYVDGNLLTSFVNHFNGSANENNNLEPNRNTIIDNTAYVESGSSGIITTTLNNLSQVKQINNILSSSGFSNRNYYINDNRKPITKNYTDRLREQ